MKTGFLPILLIAIAAVATACSSGKGESKQQIVQDVKMQGDSMVYGLACEGCTDSVVVLLPTDDSDPVTYNILEAMRNRKVFGHPKIGDQIAIIVNKDNKKKADFLIDLDELKGTWVYQVMPKLRKRPMMAGMPKPQPNPEQDSMMQTLMVPREQGFKIKKQNMMDPVGLHFEQTSLTGESPVFYPQVKYYKEWHMLNGKLVLTEGTIEIGNKKRKKAKPERDTVEIVLLMKDSLQLKFKDGIKAYYRKQ